MHRTYAANGYRKYKIRDLKIPFLYDETLNNQVVKTS